MANEDPFGLEVGYGFQTPPDEEMIRALMGQMQLGNEAKLAQPRLEKQMGQAEALRDRPAPRSTSWLSGLSQLGNTAAGLRDVRDTKRQQIEGESALANSMAAQQQAEMARGSRQENNALASTRLALANREEDYERDTAAASALAASKSRENSLNRQHELTLQGMKNAGVVGKGAKRMYTKDGEPFAGTRQGNQVVNENGEVVPQSDIMTFGEVDIPTGAHKDRMNQAPQQLETTYEFMDYTPEQWEKVVRPVGNMGHGNLTKFMMATEKHGFNDFVEDVSGFKTMSDEDQAAVRHSYDVLNRIRIQVIMPYREDTTSGALSEKDVQEFTTNIMLGEGISGEHAFDAAQSLFGKNEAFIRQQATKYDQHGDMEAWVYAQPVVKSLRNVGWREAQDKARRLAPNAVQGGGGITRDSTQVPVGQPSPAPQPQSSAPPPEVTQTYAFDPQSYQEALQLAKRGNPGAQAYVQKYAREWGSMQRKPNQAEEIQGLVAP